MLIFLRLTYFVSDKNLLKKKKPSHQSLLLSCFSDHKVFSVGFASTLLDFFCALKLSPSLMDISKTCFRVSLMNFHLKKTPSREDARSVVVFCLKQRETLSSGFPLFGPPQRNNQPRITDGIIYSFTFKLPRPFRLCLLQPSLSTSRGEAPDSPILLALRYSDWD